MKIFTFITISSINQCFSINGVIWSNKSNNFVPIFSIGQFKDLQDEVLSESRIREKHNFGGEKINFIYFDEKDIFQFFDNNKRVTGLFGDVWTTLSEVLNFTMILTKTDVKTIGTKPKPGDNFTGLLGMMQRGEYTIVPKLESYLNRLEVVDFTKSIMKERRRLFVRPNYEFKTTWMIDLFSWKIWCLIIVFYLLLSILSILVQKLVNLQNSHSIALSISEYFFYNFGALCNQGDILYIVQENFKILSFCTSLFSWLLITSFSSQLIIYVTQTILIPPFEDLETLLENTVYKVLAAKDSIVDIAFQKNYKPIYTRINEADRIEFYSDYRYIWNLACSVNKKYAVLESEYLTIGERIPCTLSPTGETYFQSWIVGGIIKGFEYKKSIDIGILKLREFGIINHLKARWLKLKQLTGTEPKYYIPIHLNQVSLVFSVYLFGLCASIIIVVFEKIVYSRSSKTN